MEFSHRLSNSTSHQVVCDQHLPYGHCPNGSFHIRKFNDDMLGYFIGEGPSLNTVLNLINEKKYDNARMQRISDLIAMPGMAKVAIIQESTTNESGHLKWDCWGCISHQYQELKMLKFVEEENISCCNVCNRDYNYGAGTKPSKRNDKGDEDNGDEVLYLEPQPRRMIKKKGTQKKHFLWCHLCR
jgi:hypothetical protein